MSTPHGACDISLLFLGSTHAQPRAGHMSPRLVMRQGSHYSPAIHHCQSGLSVYTDLPPWLPGVRGWMFRGYPGPLNL